MIKTFEARMSYASFELFQKIPNVDMSKPILKKDFVALHINHNEIIDLLNDIDRLSSDPQFDQGDVAELYLSVDAALQQYYIENNIGD